MKFIKSRKKSYFVVLQKFAFSNNIFFGWTKLFCENNFNMSDKNNFVNQKVEMHNKDETA